MKNILFFILISAFSLINAQTFLENFPIAADSTIDEIEPYVTRYWYDSWIFGYSEEVLNPLWLTYVETDSSSFYRIVAYNFGFDYQPQISLSDKFILADNSVIKSKPIIENAFGKPIAIWEENNGVQPDLYYSVLQDSVWSNPEKITDDLSSETSVNFIPLYDDSKTQENFLIRNSGNAIIAKSLNDEFKWSVDDTIYSSNNIITDIKCSYSLQKEFWIAFTEENNDSSYVMIISRSSENNTWYVPFILKASENKISSLQLNILNDYYDSHKNRVDILAYDGDLQFHSGLFVENDSIKSLTLPPVVKNERAVASNAFVSPGGCIVDPEPWFLLYDDSTLAFYIMFNSGYNDGYMTWNSNSVATNFALSGFNNLSFITAWCEEVGKQSDVILKFNYFSVGDVEPYGNEINFSLSQNYPNPFNPTTTIEYSISSTNGAPQNVVLKVYDILGREVSTLVNKEQKVGNHEVKFDASNLTSGVYFYTIQVANGVRKSFSSKKMLLIK